MPNGTGHFDKSFGNWLPDDPQGKCDHCGKTCPSDTMEEVADDVFWCRECYLTYDYDEEDDGVPEDNYAPDYNEEK